MTDTRTMRLSDGRTLAYAEYGDPEGRAVVVLHGTPGCRLTFEVLQEPARSVGVRLIAPDRPGYGRSDPTRLSFTRYTEDLRQLLDSLRIDRVPVVGVSGGGGYALAAGALLPDRVESLVLVCAMVPGAPRGALAGQSRAVALFFALGRHAPWLLARLLTRTSRSGRPAGLRLAPEPDRRVLTAAALQPALRAAAEEAMRQGPTAAVAEAAMVGRPLSFPLDQVRVPTEVVHGHLDVNVPVGVAQWVASVLPDSRLRVLADAGHLFLVERPMELLTLLA